MQDDVASIAFARAWSAYQLINTGIDKNDERRATLERFIRSRFVAGQDDGESLAVEGLKFLRKLDQSDSLRMRY